MTQPIRPNRPTNPSIRLNTGETRAADPAAARPGAAVRAHRGTSEFIALPPNPRADAMPVLRRGARGAEVRELQRMLHQAGFSPGAIDGQFGPGTDRAVRLFQRSMGLAMDGIVGPDTWGALLGAEQPRETTPQRPPEVEPEPRRETRPEPQPRVSVPQQPVESPRSPRTTSTGRDPESVLLARSLVQAGGSADAADVAAVVNSLSAVPPAVLQRMQEEGVKVVACRESITDFATELQGVRPRGWPPGATWDQVPGAYIPARRAVVVATVELGGRRVVPPFGTKHGSFEMALHEFGHGYDARDNARSDHNDEDFRRAYAADVPRLVEQREEYLLQPGDAGIQEAFAESFARYYGGDPKLRTELPNLYEYWRRTDAELREER